MIVKTNGIEPETIEISHLETSRTIPYNPEKAINDARKVIAFLLVYLLMFICAFSFIVTAWGSKDIEEPILKLSELFLSPVTGLVGAATGFYFGAKPKSK